MSSGDERERESEMLAKVADITTAKEKPKNYILPTGMKFENLVAWAIRQKNKAIELIDQRNRENERMSGRTFKEIWRKPTGLYMNISANVSQLDASGAAGPRKGFNTGVVICDEIDKYGRHSLDELCKRFQAVNEEVITVAVNTLRFEGYLIDYKERDGTQTLELVEVAKLTSKEQEEEPKKLIYTGVLRSLDKKDG